jgi:hypothetical protein
VPLMLVAEDLVCCRDFFERFGRFSLVSIWMKFHRHFVVRLLDLFIIGVFCDAQRFVIIFSWIKVLNESDLLYEPWLFVDQVHPHE